MESKIEAVSRFRFRETTSSTNVRLVPKTAVNSFAALPLLPRRGSLLDNRDVDDIPI